MESIDIKKLKENINFAYNIINKEMLSKDTISPSIYLIGYMDALADIIQNINNEAPIFIKNNKFWNSEEQK